MQFNYYGKFSCGDIVLYKSNNKYIVMKITYIDDSGRIDWSSKVVYHYKVIESNYDAEDDIFCYGSMAYDTCVKLDKNNWKSELLAKVI
jgi:hypothetical protein